MMDEDYVLVPTPFNNKKKALDYDYGTVLLAAGIDRYMLVYDSLVEYASDKIKVHRVKTDVWNKVLAIYTDFPEIAKHNKTNIVIGVSTVTQEFIKPIKSDGSYGIAALDNRNIIIDAF